MTTLHNNEQSSIEKKRHTLAHLLAMAVLETYPSAKLGIGPTIENGFYYDFEAGGALKEEDLKKFEKSIRSNIKKNLETTGKKVTPEEAKTIFKDQPFKLELIDEYVKEGRELTVYAIADFSDLCKGGHVENASEINPDAFVLSSIAGAYWRGSEKNPQLQRIYALAFDTKEELTHHIELIEEAKRRDHRKLGKELGLFVFSDLIGPGLPLYTPAGTIVLNIIKNFSRAMRTEMGYEEVQTPQINKGELFKISGHYDKFQADLFCVSSHYTEEEYFMKPMNCPQHTQVYASQMRSYKDLPIKFSDFALLYRDEKPGELSGLTRLRSFSQDDGHCFLREDQLEAEVELILSTIQSVLKKYDLSYFIRLSLWDESNKSAYLGGDSIWNKSQGFLKDLLRRKGIEYQSAEGEAAFYGPKLDFIARDALGREWQISTTQLDFNLPERFGLEYIGEDGKRYRPIMIHSALVGSPERFLGILLEHYGGAFPAWLAPVQAKILTISDKTLEYAQNVTKKLSEKMIRVTLDDRNESIGKKIREAEMEKIPYLLVIGEKESAQELISVRERGKGDLGQMSIDSFVKLI